MHVSPGNRLRPAFVTRARPARPSAQSGGASVSGSPANIRTEGRGLVSAVSAAPSAATAAAAATTRALFARPGFIDGQRSAVVLFFVQALNRRQGGVVVRHFDESKSLAAPRVPILDHLRAADRAKRREQLFQVRIRHVITQIAHIQLFTHDKTPRKTRYNRLNSGLFGRTKMAAGPSRQGE